MHARRIMAPLRQAAAYRPIGPQGTSAIQNGSQRASARDRQWNGSIQ